MKENKSYIKSITITLTLQAIIYFIINNLTKTYNILTTSYKTPLVSYSILIYHSWYPFIFFVSYLIFKNNKKIYHKLIYTLLLSFLISHITFLIYPNGIIRESINPNNIFDYIVLITYKLDNPVNCMPSIHALVCYILMYYTIISTIKPKTKILISTYLILIILSTLFTKQHLPIDLLLSAVYAIYTIIIIKKTYPKIKNKLNFLF